MYLKDRDIAESLRTYAGAIQTEAGLATRPGQMVRLEAIAADMILLAEEIEEDL